MKHRIILDYDLGEGWLAPWINGLRNGRAVASQCQGCNTARFPPLRVCTTCRTPSENWVELSGRANVLIRSSGCDGDFALVHFEGAKGAAVVRAEQLSDTAAHGHLSACPEGPPILQLEPDPSV